MVFIFLNCTWLMLNQSQLVMSLCADLAAASNPAVAWQPHYPTESFGPNNFGTGWRCVTPPLHIARISLYINSRAGQTGYPGLKAR
ncbi:hypothetical protein [Microbulbifer donghaiensis]|uniref:hypothetical protein n=1 Tax=Microbulbifer donghaiensis TaxID=494016 RepID=UPI0011612F7B|nr:hypothetical protein [Microbulbifer donghaiensis]